MNFKFFRDESDYVLRLEPMQQLTLTRRTFENVEFCFQFDEEDPVVFASGSNQCNITLDNTDEGYMTFTDNGRSFKLFAREIQ